MNIQVTKQRPSPAEEVKSSLLCKERHFSPPLFPLVLVGAVHSEVGSIRQLHETPFSGEPFLWVGISVFFSKSFLFFGYRFSSWQRLCLSHWEWAIKLLEVALFLPGAWNECRQVLGRNQIITLDSFSSLYREMASNAYISRYFPKTVPKGVKFGFNPSPSSVWFSCFAGAPVSERAPASF